MRVLALDLGGVVYRSWPDEAFHRKWAEVCGCAPEALAERLWGGSHWPLAEIGAITSGECFVRVAERVGVAPDQARALAIEAFASSPDEDLALYVESVRKRGVTVAALTNNLSREAELLARPELVRLFELVISSADVGVAKPDLAIYRNAETRLGASGEALVFVDDVLGNVEAARTLGWRAIQFRSTAQAIEDIEAALCD